MTKGPALTERRLMIEIYVTRQAYEALEIDDIGWIPTAESPADALTRHKRNAFLLDLMRGVFPLKVHTWVVRELARAQTSESNDRASKTPQIGSSDGTRRVSTANSVSNGADASD